ncbi:DUF1206 domain-containing protein [Lentzea sp. HUAS12]|uniref:DUF1206 domain-containing protein n=1 Tax=Lentzea sp. HUAS12 TaxID=2951806 RepID=UPI00209EF73B|nr:DUF1206 domain-containing protein [Lentzea sp. HUAS12]USX50249.1 DUF1206 domain-containing protein [Lentzea sp. HUAS12]
MATVAQEARRHPVVQTLGRAGMVLYGVVHVLVAWLAIQVAFGDSEQADSKGAVSDIAQGGPWLLWLLGIGLVFFALWQLLLAFVGYTYIGKKRKRISKRIGSAARAVTATGIALGAFKYATGSGSGGDQNQQQQELTAQVLSWPGGQFIVGAVAIGILAIAGVIIYKGIKKSFEKDLDMGKAPKWIEPVGRIGWIGKGSAYGVIGVLVGLAAINADPGQSGGMDKALKTLAAQPYGMFLLSAVAIGIAAFGVYCFAAARALKE